jgi:DNA polymerase I-like protein with 3'-5' exonuclease and polymerase domains
MDLITLDWETYYDQQYSLSKLTTEEYIRDDRFEVIGLCAKHNDGPVEWFSGDHDEVAYYLAQFDWANSGMLSHNTMFDAAIQSWRFGIKPKVLFDTLSMSRALHGVNARHSLKAVAERYGVGEKGNEVQNALGKRRADFSRAELARYGEYCKTDAQLCYDIFNIMLSRGFPKAELKLIDLTLRMFTDPVLELDIDLLEGHLISTKRAKEKLLTDAGVTDKKDLMSNNKFADMLRGFGVEPPMKVSPTTGKETYAFAKTDEDFKALEEHEDERVQTIVAARLGNKSTIEETRTERFIGIAKRGKFPVPLRYYAAHTGRWGGSDKVNLQNLPSRGPNAKKLKSAILAPDGHVLIDADSAQIEARVLAWLAEQEDVVETFAANGDVYKRMASQIFGVDELNVTKEQRQIGKVVILGAGYGVGHVKLQAFLKMQAGVEVDLDEAKRIIDIYRHSNNRISALWRAAQKSIEYMERGDRLAFGRPGVLDVDPAEKGVVLPNGLMIRYDGLHAEQSMHGYEYTYVTRNGPNRIYGGKVIENVCQAIARCIIGEQLVKIAKKHRVVLTVHDSIVVCVSEEQAEEAQAYVEQCMRWTPDWAAGLPVNCESGIGRSYGEC